MSAASLPENGIAFLDMLDIANDPEIHANISLTSQWQFGWRQCIAPASAPHRTENGVRVARGVPGGSGWTGAVFFDSSQPGNYTSFSESP